MDLVPFEYWSGNLKYHAMSLATRITGQPVDALCISGLLVADVLYRCLRVQVLRRLHMSVKCRRLPHWPLTFDLHPNSQNHWYRIRGPTTRVGWGAILIRDVWGRIIDIDGV